MRRRARRIRLWLRGERFDVAHSAARGRAYAILRRRYDHAFALQLVDEVVGL